MFKHDFKPTDAERDAAENHLDRLRSVKALEVHSRTIVVGENACGKSLFRQIVNFGTVDKVRMLHASMQLRTASNPGMGALSSMTHDLPWLATSHCTLHVVEQVLKQFDSRSDNGTYGICVDEPEIGLGMGAQRGLARWLFQELDRRATLAAGSIVITHSPIFVRAGLQSGWNFLDLSPRPAKDAGAWLAKQEDPQYEIAPEALLAQAEVMFLTVRDRINAMAKE